MKLKTTIKVSGLLAFILVSLSHVIIAQTFRDNPALKNFREKNSAIDSLMKKGIMIEPNSGLKYFTGYDYKTLYDWDQYFESIVQIYMGWKSEYIKNGVLLFLKNQQDNGFIPRSVPSNSWHDNEHVKPFLAQISLMVYKEYNEKDWILNTAMFARLQKYLDYWLYDMDSNKNGLSEWMSAPHTGMDNQHERAGFWLDRCSEGVDLNCYLVRETSAFAELATLKGDKKLANKYNQISNELKVRIQKEMWNPADGFFYDLKVNPDKPLSKSAQDGARMNHERNMGKYIPVKSAAAFTTLFAQVATPEQAQSLVFKYLFNPREFWSAYPVTVLSKSEPWYSTGYMPSDVGCSWRANTWMPTNYMIFHGLKYYDYFDLAKLLANQTNDLMAKSGSCEYYNTETGEGLGLNPFWGWSLLGYFFDLEDKLENDINAISTSNSPLKVK